MRWTSSWLRPRRSPSSGGGPELHHARGGKAASSGDIPLSVRRASEGGEGGGRRGRTRGSQRERRVHLRQEAPAGDRSAHPLSHQTPRVGRGGRPRYAEGTTGILRSHRRGRGRGRQDGALPDRGGGR